MEDGHHLSDASAAPIARCETSAQVSSDVSQSFSDASSQPSSTSAFMNSGKPW